MAAPRKAKSATPKASASAATTERPATTPERRPARQIPPTAGSSDPNRLLREAAWSRMFGRIESKNPFTR
jgi:hypothetical protein